MYRVLFGGTVALVSAAAALAQGVPGIAPGGPPPAMLQAMQGARTEAKLGANAALSADHRARVNAIVDAFDHGSIPSARDAAARIDAVLSPAESAAVLDRRRTMRGEVAQTMSSGGGAAGGFSGPPPGGGLPQMPGSTTPDAGRFLLSLDADAAVLHAAQIRDRAGITDATAAP